MKLVIENIGKKYAGRDVLRGCSWTFDGPGISVLMGPNGCGKSTLLRICSLLEQPDHGELQFQENDRTLPRDLALRRRMTLVPPRTGVFNTTVFANIAYGLRIRGMQKQEIEARVRNVLAFVRLEHKERQPARTLSSGETQRLGIARALAIEPDVLFLDEPTASVDEENTLIIEEIIRELRNAGRTAVIMTTHDRDQAERLADRVLKLEQGELKAG